MAGGSKKDMCVTYILAQEVAAHRSGVNAVAQLDNLLYTASRDGTVREWTPDGRSMRHLRCFEGHADWINDIAIDPTSRTLITASSDTTVKLWSLNEGSESHTLRKHTDYVKTIAFAPLTHQLASAGLDNNVYIWDLQQIDEPVVAKAHKDSVYCSAITPDAHLLATAGTDRVVRLWDARQSQKIASLKGHTDTIRAIALSEDGQYAITGSSDKSVRIWDLATRRCLRTIRAHTDSVWSLCSLPGTGRVLAGGRDGRVFSIDVATGVAHLLFTEESSVLCLQGAAENTAWVATLSPSVRLWPAAAPPGDLLERARLTPASPMRSPHPHQALMPLHAAPITHTISAASIVCVTVLNDRDRILTKDSDGHVMLWSALKGVMLENFGRCNYDDKLQELQEILSVPQWFTTDFKTGSLAITLRHNLCFAAELFAVDIGIEAANDQVKVNLGERVLLGLFAHWRAGRKRIDDEEDENEDEQTQKYVPAPFPDHVPVVITDNMGACVLRKQCGQLNGSEYDEKFPSWVTEWVLHNRSQAPEQPKISFTLLPASTSKLPELPQGHGKLNAPRILRVTRVIIYTQGKLEQFFASKEAKEHPPPKEGSPGVAGGGDASQSPAATAAAAAAAAAFASDPIEIVIGENEQLLPVTMSLATIRAFMWKGGGDVVLKYRRRSEAPPPAAAAQIVQPAAAAAT
eukprot:TRINITY_DN9365_c0_g1_i1.p1 TRINITY_DN9365_c0_g1~~TRINITY_DN9365_c0_g1_i1.p1  ORF type:complete len:689 (+),score=148.96 TRINITY_DN9365_c0_g1_i1:86-2152(+)